MTGKLAMAVSRAMELGVQGLELSVRRSRDQVPVVVDDLTPDRITDGHGDVPALDATDLQRLVGSDGKPFPPSVMCWSWPVEHGSGAEHPGHRDPRRGAGRGYHPLHRWVHASAPGVDGQSPGAWVMAGGLPVGRNPYGRPGRGALPGACLQGGNEDCPHAHC